MDKEKNDLIVKDYRYYKSNVQYSECHNTVLSTGEECLLKLQPVNNVTVDGRLIKKGFYCPRCQILYQSRNPKENENADTADNKRVVLFDQPDVVLYIGKGITFCQRENHHLESVTGLLKKLKGGYAKINVNYCEEENIYFISYNDYQFYKQEYGTLLGNYVLPSHLKSGNGFSSLPEESPLHEYGYNVSKGSGLTAYDRQRILANIMDYGLMKKSRIIEYLDAFLGIHELNSKYDEACQKWEADREWVRKYKLEDQRRIKILETKKYR